MNATFANTKPALEVSERIRSCSPVGAREEIRGAHRGYVDGAHRADRNSAHGGSAVGRDREVHSGPPAKLGTVWLPAGDYKYSVSWTSSLPLLSVAKSDSTVNEFIFPAAIKQISEPADTSSLSRWPTARLTSARSRSTNSA